MNQEFADIELFKVIPKKPSSESKIYEFDPLILWRNFKIVFKPMTPMEINVE